MRILCYTLLAALVIFLPGAPGLSAQQQGQQQSPQQAQQQTPGQSAPIPALAGNGQSDTGSPDADSLVPDTRSLAGAQDVSLGGLKTGYSYWLPYLQVSATFDSNPLSAGGTGWSTWPTFFGGVDLHRTSENSDLMLSYLGGGAFSNTSGVGNATFEQLGLAERLTFHRATVAFLDEFAYLPEANFGYAGIGGSYLQNGGNIGLASGFTPNQSILTALGQRVSNTVVAEGNAYLTPRSYFTFVGSYGLLDFFASNLDNNNETIGQVGYNYQMTRKDTIAVLYRFDALRFENITQWINSNSVELAYSRRVTGRLAFQLTGGPNYAISEAPLTGPLSSSTETTSPAAAPEKTRQFLWNLYSVLDYRLQRTELTASYGHGVSGGSGVLAGAVTQNFSGSARRQFTRSFNGAWIVGYSRNTGLGIVSPLALTVSDETYDYYFTGVNVRWNFARSTSLYLGYQVNYQLADVQFCITSPCNTNFLEHEITMSLGWRPERPFTF
jgi:hypothetical protein